MTSWNAIPTDCIQVFFCFHKQIISYLVAVIIGAVSSSFFLNHDIYLLNAMSRFVSTAESEDQVVQGLFELRVQLLGLGLVFRLQAFELA